MRQEKRYRLIPDIFITPYFFAKKHATFAINRDLNKKSHVNIWDHHLGCSSRIDFKLRINTDHFKLVLKRYNSHRGRASLRSLSISTSRVIEVDDMQCRFHESRVQTRY